MYIQIYIYIYLYIYTYVYIYTYHHSEVEYGLVCFKVQEWDPSWPLAGPEPSFPTFRALQPGFELPGAQGACEKIAAWGYQLIKVMHSKMALWLFVPPGLPVFFLFLSSYPSPTEISTQNRRPKAFLRVTSMMPCHRGKGWEWQYLISWFICLVYCKRRFAGNIQETSGFSHEIKGFPGFLGFSVNLTFNQYTVHVSTHFHRFLCPLQQQPHAMNG